MEALRLRLPPHRHPHRHHPLLRPHLPIRPQVLAAALLLLAAPHRRAAHPLRPHLTRLQALAVARLQPRLQAVLPLRLQHQAAPPLRPQLLAALLTPSHPLALPRRLQALLSQPRLHQSVHHAKHLQLHPSRPALHTAHQHRPNLLLPRHLHPVSIMLFQSFSMLTTSSSHTLPVFVHFNIYRDTYTTNVRVQVWQLVFITSAYLD